VCNHQLKKQKSCAAQLIQAGAKVAIVTCDVEYAAAATQEFINKGILTLSPCVTTDQMGPQRFGAKGRLAFTVGGTAQDEGSAEAEYAYSRGWRTAVVVKDNFLVYFRDVSDAFAKRFTELGGKVVQREAFASFDKTIGNVISKVASTDADVISFVTAFGELPQFVGGIRSAGNNTPIINSWGGDGTYWNPKNPQVTEYYVDNYASSFGDDPNPAVNKLLGALLAAKKVPYTASFVLGAATIDALAAALKRNGGSTNGLSLATTFEKFRNLPTISGPITFSRTLHSVVNRPWRIMKVQNNKETYLRMWKTKKVVSLK
jgi:branched-chain amino acid transport system substrate-binding protein